MPEWEAQLGRGYYVRRGTNKAPRDWYVLERGLPTTTAVRHVLAVAPSIAELRELEPDAFPTREEPSNA
jgi:hypothetical protein